MSKAIRIGVRCGVVKAVSEMTALGVLTLCTFVGIKLIKVVKEEIKDEKETTDADDDSSTFRPSWFNF